jgi:ATP synthase protein I
MAAMSLIGPEGRKQLQLAARFATAGLELVIAICVGYFGGRLLDRWFGTDPVCGYVGLILGIVAGFRNLFLLARTANKTADKSPAAVPPETTSPPPDNSEDRP